MNVNCKLTLTDDERRRLADVIDGKETKRLATRKDVVAYCEGAVRAAFDRDVPEAPPPVRASEPDVVRIPEPYATRYADRSAAWRSGWLRGWNAKPFRRN